MSASTDPVDSNRQMAVDRLDRLDRLAQSVDGRTIPSRQVYELAAEVVGETCGFVPAIDRRSSTGDQRLIDTNVEVESNGVNPLEVRSEIPPLASIPLAGNELIVLRHSDESKALDSDWQYAFLTSVAECCGVAFLKQFYADSPLGLGQSTLRNTKVDESRSWWPMALRVGAFVVALFFVSLFPVTFRLPTEGAIRPAVSVGVFAPTAGKLTQIAVQDGTDVKSGDVLATIDSPELRLQAERLRGELLAAQADLLSTRLSSSDQNSRSDNTRGQAGSSSTKVAVLRTRIKSFLSQVELIDEILESLVIRASHPGRVVISDRQSDSVGQAVLPSQQLMTVADNRQGYEAIVRVPAKSYGYLQTDATASETPATASLRLRSDPNRRFEGPVTRISDTVQIDEQGQSTVNVTVNLKDFNDSDIRFDAPLIGHIYAGRRSLGFVIFRPIIEFIRENSW